MRSNYSKNYNNQLMSRDNNQDQQLRKEIIELENQIYDLETFYLQKTRQSGNLIKGFDNYLNARAPRNQLNKKPKIQNIQRLFSLTSFRSKTSQAIEEGPIDRGDNNQVQANKRRGIRNKAKGGYVHDADSGDNNSMSGGDFQSMDESSNNNKGRKKQKRIQTGGKGTRK